MLPAESVRSWQTFFHLVLTLSKQVSSVVHVNLVHMGQKNIISCALHAKLRQCSTNQKPVVAIVKMGSYGRYECSSLCPQVLRASLTLQHALTPSN